MEELRLLRAEESRLRREIDRYPEKEPQRRELQGQLEALLHQQAEAEELHRVALATEKAVESGFVVCATVNLEDIGDCPICLERIVKQPAGYNSVADVARQSCCGNVICKSCYKNTQDQIDAAAKAYADTPEENVDERNARMAEINSKSSCPFCRKPIVVELGLYCQQLVQQATAGKAWAQHEIGKRFLSVDSWSKYVPMDATKALEWLKLGAEQGDALSNDLLSSLYASGRPQYGIPQSWAKFTKYSRAAARQGHAFSQVNCAHNEDEGTAAELTWCTLAAAQGLPEGQHRMGILCRAGRPKLPKSWFKAIYWLRKAALQGNGDAMVDLAWTLLHAKKAIFGHVNIIRHSAMPETIFWFGAAEKFKDGFATPAFCPFSKCDMCFADGKLGETLMKCAKCLSLTYCSRECQIQHWKLGHKICCKGVDTYRTALKALEASLVEKAKYVAQPSWKDARERIENGKLF